MASPLKKTAADTGPRVNEIGEILKSRAQAAFLANPDVIPGHAMNAIFLSRIADSLERIASVVVEEVTTRVDTRDIVNNDRKKATGAEISVEVDHETMEALVKLLKLKD